MTVAMVPSVLSLSGLLMYLFARGGKTMEIGRILFFCGMLVLTYTQIGRSFKLPF
jgi:hypothetical protein